MNKLYIELWIHMVLGFTYFGIIVGWSSGNDWHSMLTSGFVGVIAYFVYFYFTRGKKYNKLVKAFKLLNIDDNEKFEAFIKEYELRNGGIDDED